MENDNKQEYQEYNDTTEVADNQTSNTPTPAKRTGGMTFVLILSMIGSGWGILVNLLWGLTQPIMSSIWQTNNNQLPDELMAVYSQMEGFDAEVMNDIMRSFLNIPQYHYLLLALFSAMSLAGVIMMWKMRKTGFHCYTLAQLMMLLLTAFLGKAYIGVGDIMITLLFVAFYAINIFKPTKVQ